MNSVKEKCKGKITRQRITKKKREESIIDFVIVCDKMNEIVTELVIGEEKQHALTSFRKTKTGHKVIVSDHNSMITHVKASWNKKEPKSRTEIYNLKDKEGMKNFNKITSKDNFLSDVFNSEGNIETKTKKFLKQLNCCLSMSFKKIRVNKTKRNKKIEELFTKRRILQNKKDEESHQKLKAVEAQLAEICASDNLAINNEAWEGLSCESGGVNANKLWKLKKKLQGIVQEAPAAMLDFSGNLLTTTKAREKLTIEVHKDRLEPNQMKKSLQVHQMQHEEKWKQRLKEAQSNITPDWTMDNLNTFLNFFLKW